MSDLFIGRVRELASLRAEFARTALSLVIVYERRRIGIQERHRPLSWLSAIPRLVGHPASHGRILQRVLAAF